MRVRFLFSAIVCTWATGDIPSFALCPVRAELDVDFEPDGEVHDAGHFAGDEVANYVKLVGQKGKAMQRTVERSTSDGIVC